MKRRVLLIAAALLLLSGCAPGADNSALTSQRDAAQSAAWEDAEIPFAAQYIRTDGYAPDVKHPAAAVIRSAGELEEYYAANKDVYDLGSREKAYPDTTIGFADAMKKYDDAYFEDNALILVLLLEPSNWIGHNVSSVTADDSGIGITIERLLPEEQYQETARWHIFVETGKQCTDGEIRIKLVDKYYTARESTEVPFTAKYVKTAGYFTWPTASAIYSLAGLEEYYASRKNEYFLDGIDKDDTASESFRDAMEKYDDTYFENNALILVRITDAVPRSYSVKSITAGGNAVTVTLERKMPEQPCIPASWHAFVEAGKLYISEGSHIDIKTLTVSEESQIPFAARYIRGGYVSALKYPVTTVMRSAAELENYITADMGVNDAMKRYDEAYFEDNALVLIQFVEPSGSIRHNVSSVTLDGSAVNITIERLLPEVQTCDMAGWHTFVETAKDKARDNVTVTFADIDSKPPLPV